MAQHIGGDRLTLGDPNTGRPNVGGPIVTGGGLVFIAATDDKRLRAFDTKTGKELWTLQVAGLDLWHAADL